MNSAESWVPASICMACSSAEGASTLSEVRVVGLYQYIFVSSFPKRTMSLMFPLLRALKQECSANFALTFSEVRMAPVLCCQYPRTLYGLSWSGLSGERLRVPQDLAPSASKC